LRGERQKLNKAIRRGVLDANKPLRKKYDANRARRRELRLKIRDLKAAPPSQVRDREEGKLEAKLDKLIRKGESLAENIGDLVKLAFENTPEGQRYQSTNDKITSLGKSHPKCDGCTLFFGEYHLANETFKVDNLKFCQYCQMDYKRYGEKFFLRRVKAAKREDSN